MEKLHPTVIKKNLVVASLFITAYDLLKASIEDHIKGFLGEVEGFDESGQIKYKTTDEYRKEILNRDIVEVDNKKSDFQVLYASCLWFQDMGAITEDDVKDIQAMRKQRNKIAHGLPALLINEDISIDVGLLVKAQYLMTKVNKWWILNIEIPISPDFTPDMEIDESDVESPMALILDYFIEIAADELSTGS